MIIFDIETDGYRDDVSKIHCIVCYDSASGNIHQYTSSFHKAIELMNNSSGVVGHNITSYDIPVLKKFFPSFNPKAVYDTYLASCLLFPDIEGGHSLEAWATRLGTPQQKIQIDDWSVYSQEMLDRCTNDVLINKAVQEYISGKLHPWSVDSFQKAMLLEQDVSRIHAIQETTGVRIDVRKAVKLINEIDARSTELRHKILAGVPPTIRVPSMTKKGFEEVRTSGGEIFDVRKPFKKDGSLSNAALGHKLPNITGPYTRVEFEPLNLNSDQQIKDYLLSIGWKPTEWNFTTDTNGKKVKSSPKLTEESYSSLPQGLGQMIGEFSVCEHRRNYLLSRTDRNKGLLAVTNRYPGKFRIPAKALTCATPTFRYRHMECVCNVPRPGTAYGEEIRDLFTVEEDSWMIGADLSGIEARMMMHYVLFVAYKSNNPIYIKEAEELADIVLNGDYHTHNAKAWNVSRNSAKSGLYALMYGCGEAKLASTLGKSANEGAKAMREFWDSNKPLKRLVDTLDSSYSNHPGYLTGIEGRILQIRDKRKSLNSLLQSGAAVVFKRWMVKCNEFFDLETVKQLIAYHDELQFEVTCTNSVANNIGEQIVEFAGDVGKEMGLLVPIKAEFKIGKSWKETH